jgi:hypothetical protein
VIPDLRYVETWDALCLISDTRVELFNLLVTEARLGPGLSSVTVMLDLVDGYGALTRVYRVLSDKQVAGR